MDRTLVFIPVTRDELDAITGARVLRDRVAHTVTPELMDELGYEDGQEEDAEYATLVLASVASLAQYGERLVLVAEIPSSRVSPAADAANGQCRVDEVPTGSITCWFADDESVDPSGAAEQARGLGIDEAWEADAVSRLIHGHQLLWNDVEEFKRGL